MCSSVGGEEMKTSRVTAADTSIWIYVLIADYACLARQGGLANPDLAVSVLSIPLHLNYRIPRITFRDTSPLHPQHPHCLYICYTAARTKEKTFIAAS